MTKRRESQFFTVRNEAGQYLGTYRAFTAQEAINSLISEDHQTASTFRKSHPATKFGKLTAAVEPTR